MTRVWALFPPCFLRTKFERRAWSLSEESVGLVKGITCRRRLLSLCFQSRTDSEVRVS